MFKDTRALNFKLLTMEPLSVYLAPLVRSSARIPTILKRFQLINGFQLTILASGKANGCLAIRSHIA